LKLQRIQATEPTVKHSFAFKQSTADLLSRYQQRYLSVHGIEITMKDMVELMLLSFMADDKAFQKAIKTAEEAAHAPQAEAPPAPAPTAATQVAAPAPEPATVPVPEKVETAPVATESPAQSEPPIGLAGASFGRSAGFGGYGGSRVPDSGI